MERHREMSVGGDQVPPWKVQGREQRGKAERGERTARTTALGDATSRIVEVSKQPECLHASTPRLLARVSPRAPECITSLIISQRSSRGRSPLAAVGSSSATSQLQPRSNPSFSVSACAKLAEKPRRSELWPLIRVGPWPMASLLSADPAPCQGAKAWPLPGVRVGVSQGTPPAASVLSHHMLPSEHFRNTGADRVEATGPSERGQRISD